MSLNHIYVVGRIGRIDSRATKAGTYTSVSVAVSEKWTDRKTGESKENTEWIPCVAFGRTAELMRDNFSKGDQIGLEGKIRTRSYEKDGHKHYATEVLTQNLLYFPEKQKPAEKEFDFNQAPAFDEDESIPF